MAHVPLILNPDKTKLSKRQADISTEDYLKKGYLKEALFNFMALLGWNPGEGVDKEIFSKDEFVELFSIERVNSAGAVFNIDKLNWFNSEYIKNYDLTELTKLSVPYLEAAGYDISNSSKNERAISAARNYINKLDEIAEQTKIYYTDKINLSDEQSEIITNDSSKQVLTALISKIKALSEITNDNLKPVLNEIQKETGVKGKALFQPVRLALTGEEHGPELGVVAYVLGKDEVLKRINKLLNNEI